MKKIISKLWKLTQTIVSRIGIKYNHTGMVALCCMGKCENEYIIEYVNYYKNLGIDHIFIYDNNDVEGERFEDVLSDFVESGFVEIIDYRGKKCCQEDAYDHCYKNRKGEYDWICVFDCDEFLTLKKHKNIKEFLSDPLYTNFQLMHVNWMCFGDNELLENDGRGCIERFTTPLPFNFRRFENFPENNHIKTIIRGGLKHVNYHFVTHTPNSYYRCCNPLGIECDPRSPYCPYNFDVAYLRHYYTKTIGEWIHIKQKRGYGDMDDEMAKNKLGLDVFYLMNNRTEEKDNYAKFLIQNVQN